MSNTNRDPRDPKHLVAAAVGWVFTMTIDMTTWAQRDRACRLLLTELVSQGVVSPDEDVYLDITSAEHNVVRFGLAGGQIFELDPKTGTVKAL
jgi:hypothetical protein